MRRICILLVVVFVAVGLSWGQDQSTVEARLKTLAPYSQMRAQHPGLTLQQYNAAVRQVASQYSAQQPSFGSSPVNRTQYLGRLSTNQYAPDSTANPYGRFGSPYSPTSINNPYSTYRSPYSPQGVNNPYATATPKLYGQDGQYLGKVSSNPYDPDSISNPYGRFGSPYSPTSINNPYSAYGSPYSPQSPTNSYTLTAPVIVDDDD